MPWQLKQEEKRKEKKGKGKKDKKKEDKGKGEGKENRKVSKHFEKERNGGEQRNEGICLICCKLIYK